MEILQISVDDKILIIAPHPDDECIGPGGILTLYSKQCELIVMTDGSIGQGNMKTEECKEIRTQEFINEMNILGISEYTFMNISDGMLMNHLKCLNSFDLGKYTKIFVTGDNDGHSDHTAAMLCVLNAIKEQKIEDIELYLYEIHNLLQQPTHYLDVSDVIDSKKGLIKCHKSQLGKIPYDEYVYTSALYRGFQNRMSGRFLEVYKKIPTKYTPNKDLIAIEKELQKFKQFYNVMTKWLMMDDPSMIYKWFVRNNITHCVIYGYAELGQILEKMLLTSGIEIRYILDRKVIESNNNIAVYRLGDEPDVNEIVIVTAIFYYDVIKEELEKRGYRKIISLKEIIDQT